MAIINITQTVDSARDDHITASVTTAKEKVGGSNSSN